LKGAALFLSAAAAAGAARDASACTCPAPSPCEAFGAASAVFLGAVVQEPDASGVVRFRVQETLKGERGDESRVFVDRPARLRCGDRSSLASGEAYVVYVGGDAGGQAATCLRAVPTAAAADDLRFLRELPAEGSGGTVFGSVWVDRPDRDIKLLRDATVVVRGAGGERRATSGPKGAFEITSLPPGEYLVEATMPAGYVAAESSRTVAVPDRGCRQVNLEARPGGGIEGRVVDARGRGVPATVKLHADGDDDPARFLSARAAADGRFAVRTVPPGAYHLFLDLRRGDGTHRYFHPGVDDESRATTIRIGLGETADGYELALPSDLLTVAVRGLVRWPDGRPAPDVEVALCADPGAPGPRSLLDDAEARPARTGTDGRFELLGWAGRGYRLQARTVGEAAQGQDARGAQGSLALAREDVTGLELVLGEPAPPALCGGKAAASRGGQEGRRP
jgi:hypothetical protein